MKKIRIVYWHMRDRGKGKLFMMLALILVLSVTGVCGLLGRKIYVSVTENRQVTQSVEGTSGGTSEGTSSEEESSVSAPEEPTEMVHVEVHVETCVLITRDKKGQNS